MTTLCTNQQATFWGDNYQKGVVTITADVTHTGNSMTFANIAVWCYLSLSGGYTSLSFYSPHVADFRLICNGVTSTASTTVPTGTYHDGDLLFGPIYLPWLTCTVPAQDTSVTMEVSRDGDGPYSFTASGLPAGGCSINVNVMRGSTEDTSGATAVFDGYINGEKVLDQVGDNPYSWINPGFPDGTTYEINNITLVDTSYYYAGNASYSGTLTPSGTVVELQFWPRPSVTVGTATQATITGATGTYIPGDTVSFSVVPDVGYAVSSVVAMETGGSTVPVTDLGSNNYSFTMPNTDVTVSAVATAISRAVYVPVSSGGSTVSKKAGKVYVSVGGQSKEAKKLYVSVNGVSKLVLLNP